MRRNRCLALTVSLLLGALALPASSPAARRVLLVGSYKGERGRYRSIQAAVNAARRGDYILVGPGVYHERGDHAGRYKATGSGKSGGALWIGKSGLTIRGMNRNRVVVDGTKPGRGAACSTSPARQDLGPLGRDGKPLGRNGVEVFKAAGVSIENLTACNFLTGAGGGGNQIWFNNGDGSGVQRRGSFFGSYLSATNSYYAGPNTPDGAYGIFVSNSAGPGKLIHTYASNQDDSSYYVGACRDCNTTIDDAHAQYSALGYSGTNSGGHLVVQKSEWDNNKTGIVTNSQNNDDAPSPALGFCPHNPTRSCTFFQYNKIHDNNNPNVPGAGAAALGPVGTGLVLAGVRGDTVRGNQVYGNNAWGVVAVPFPDTETPPPVAHCVGGTPNANGFACYYDDFGNQVSGNRFLRNGGFGNATNGDLVDISGQNTPGNCFHGNRDTAGLTSAPANLEATHGTCGAPNAGASLGDPVTLALICNTELLGAGTSCLGPAANSNYPRTTRVVLPKLRPQATMPNPCKGVPANAWCSKR